MDKVINLGIPHVGELIFESFDNPGLIKCLEVSETWKALAENVLTKRKGVMLEACKSGETKVVQLLLERCNSEESGLNTKDHQRGWTAFMLACYNGHKDVVKLLLDLNDSSIELNAKVNVFNCTALHLACMDGHKDVVQLLLDHSESNIELNAKDELGWTAFTLACCHGRKGVVKLLLDHYERIELNVRDENGETPFMSACMNGECWITAELLSSGPLPPGHSGIWFPHPLLHPYGEGRLGVDRGQDPGARGGQPAHQGHHVLLQVLHVEELLMLEGLLLRLETLKRGLG